MGLERQAFCLSSKSIIGKVVSLKEITKNQSKDNILVVDRLSLNELIPLIEKNMLSAVVVRAGSLADHMAVLLNGKGIQLAVAPLLPNIESGTQIFIDGENEKIIVNSQGSFRHEKSKDSESEKKIEPEGLSLNYFGEKVSIKVDGKTADELSSGLKNGATGIGILRTEWLGWSDELAPTEKVNFALYNECIKKVSPHKLNIRLFDLGGDKIPKWVKSNHEPLVSPLGARGIRAMDYLTEAFESQLKAICNLAENTKIGIIIPMVTDTNDIKKIKDNLLKLASKKAISNISIGSMIEVPAAAIKIKEILNEAEFVRIGPGDLTQFCLAKLRSNLSPVELSGSSMHPAVLDLIEKVIKEGKNMNKETNLCLDFEPRIQLLKKLLQIGVRTFCVSPQNVPITIKRINDIIGETNPKKE